MNGLHLLAYRLFCLSALLLLFAQPAFADSWNSLMEAGEVARESNNQLKAIACYQSALKVAETFGEQDPRLTETIRNLADAYSRHHELAKAEQLYLRELTILKTIGENYSDVVHDYYALGDIYSARGNYKEADKYYRKALAVVEKCHNANNKERYFLLYALGHNCRKLHLYDEADSFFDRMIAIKREINPSAPESAEDFESKADNYLDQEKYHEAELAFMHALPLEKMRGPSGPTLTILLCRLASVFLHEKKFDEARQASKEFQSIASRYRGPEISLPHYLAELGHEFYAAEKLSDAEPLLKLALSDRFSGSKFNAREKADTMVYLATIFKIWGRLNQAASLYEQAARHYEVLAGPQSLDVAHCYSWLGQVRLQQKQGKEAERLFRKALAITQHFPKTNTRETASVLRCLAGAKLIEKNYPEAEAFYRQALSLYEKEGDTRLISIVLKELSMVLRFENRIALADQMAARAKSVKSIRKGSNTH